MPLEPLSPAAFAFIAQVESTFTGLMRFAAAQKETGQNESGLAGKLLYAGNLDPAGRAFTAAAAIAGAATLAACADPAPAKQAMRDGIVDFLVNSLDEALRILKNQVRKRETVAVCVSLAPASIEAEMRERGVVPDLSFSQDLRGAPTEDSPGALTGAQRANLAPPLDNPRAAGEETEEEKTWLTWRVAASPALWLPKLNVLALDSLAPDDIAARRWLERAPRILGRLAQNTRTLRTTKLLADRILARFRDEVSGGQISTAVEITVGPWDSSHAQSLSPSVP
jgi:hypothetical protein